MDECRIVKGIKSESFVTIFFESKKNGFWYWLIDRADWIRFFNSDEEITPKTLNLFCDSSENDTIGCATGHFKTLEEAEYNAAY